MFQEIIMCVAAYLVLQCRANQEAWVATSGSSGNDFSTDFALDASGNVYVVGYTNGAFEGQPNYGGFDIYLMKYSSDGTKLWVEVYGSTGNDYPIGLALDGSGGVYIVGYTDSYVEGQPYYGYSLGGYLDTLVMKYSSDGTKLWVHVAESSAENEPTGFALDGSSSVYVVGYTNGVFEGQSYNGGIDIFVMKYNTDGTKLWAQVSGSSGDDEPTGLSLDGSGGVYVVGVINGAIEGQPYYGKRDVCVFKYDSNGTKLWVDVSGSSGNDWLKSLAFDGLGNAYIVGYTDDIFDGQPYYGGFDIYLIKYHSNGTKLWTQVSGSSSDDFPTGLVLDGSGNAYIVGYTNGVFEGQPYYGFLDTLVIKYSSDGTKLWARVAGSSSDDSPTDFAVDGSGSVNVVGITYGAFENQSYYGKRDIYLIKYDSNGTKLWAQVSGSSGDDVFTAFSLDGSSNVYIVGYTDGAFEGQPSYGGYDIYLMKYNSNGTKLWVDVSGSTGYDEPIGLALDGSGDVFVVGDTNGIFEGRSYYGGSDVFVMKTFDTDDDEETAGSSSLIGSPLLISVVVIAAVFALAFLSFGVVYLRRRMYNIKDSSINKQLESDNKQAAVGSELPTINVMHSAVAENGNKVISANDSI